MEQRTASSSSFGSLSNACLQLRENWRLALLEANTAGEDLHVAQNEVQAVERRRTKAEKRLCHLWEDNCAMRDLLGSEEQRLVLELEEHVMASLRLHEQFLAANGGAPLQSRPSRPPPPEETVVLPHRAVPASARLDTGAAAGSAAPNTATSSCRSVDNDKMSPLDPKKLSLMDVFCHQQCHLFGHWPANGEFHVGFVVGQQDT